MYGRSLFNAARASGRQFMPVVPSFQFIVLAIRALVDCNGLCRVSMCLCRRKAWCDQKAEEASSAGYIAVDIEEASKGRYIPCGR
jgi:hypothetical protein